jgi:hypothetical protein
MKKIVLLTIVLFSFLFSNGQITNPAPYCDGAFNDNNGPPLPEWISKVVLGTLNNNSPDQPYPHYAYYDSVAVPNLMVGNNYTISITFQAFNDGYAAWIDYNHDDLFDTVTEKIMGNAPNTPIGPGAVTKTGNFTVPLNATLGITRMRVRQVNDTGYNHTHSYLIAPCNYDSTIMHYGSCLDFNVNIVATTGIQSLANNSGSVSYYLSGNSLNIRKTLNDKVEMKIYNALGELIKSSTMINPLNTIDVSSLRAGIYFVQFSGDKDFISTGKFVR